MPKPYEVRKASRSEYLETVLLGFQRLDSGLPQLLVETVWKQSWTLPQIQKTNQTGWADSTGVYFFSDFCTETDPKGEYVDERFSFFQRIGLAKDRSFRRRLKDYSHFVDYTVGRGKACDKNNWTFRYCQLDVIRICPEETDRLERYFLRTIATFQNKRDVPTHMVYQPIIFDSQS